jgi:hypothetical protein
MKKLLIIFSGIIILITAACEDFLKEENYSSVVATDLYSTQSGYEGLVNTCYSSLRDIFGDEAWVFCAGTDMYVEGRSPQPEGLSEYYNLSPTDGFVLKFYSNLYKTIQLCNTAVFYNEKTEETNALPQRLAEVRFLRAFAYFKLLQHFGGVSIVTEMIDEPVVSIERKSAEEVYGYIISELEDVLDDLPESASDFGRASQRAVNHYLAKVYLTRGYESFGSANDFSMAADYAEQAINNQELNLTYSEVFIPGNESNEEILFSVQYGPESIVDVSEDGNLQNYYFGPYLGSEGNEKGYPHRSYDLCATKYVWELYTEFDSRWEASFMTIIYERYYDYFDRANEHDQLTVTEYYPHYWEIDKIEEWRDASPLRADAIIYPYNDSWEASTASDADRMFPAIKKFDDPNSVFSNDGSSTRDIFLARLGETYLIAAEAYFKAGDPAKAAEKLNVVRTRAAKPGHEAEMQLSAGEININKILDERALELLGEYHRWEDLRRTGTLVERTKLYNRDIIDWFDSGINPFMGNDGNLKLLRPIPQEAIDLNQNESVTQNPGYN